MRLPLFSASKKYKYTDKYYGRQLNTWVSLVYSDLCMFNGWMNTRLMLGTYAYDSYATSIVYILDNLKIFRNNKFSIYHCALLAHNGWCENYTYWRDHEFFIPNDDDDEYSLLVYDLLPFEYQKRNSDIAKTVLKILIKDITPRGIDYCVFMNYMWF